MAKLMRFDGRYWRIRVAAMLLLPFVLSGAPALAQSSDGKPGKAGAVAATDAAPAVADTAGLKARIETLEEQLVDMQVVVGTLESLAKNGGAAAPAYSSSSAPATAPAPADGDTASRIDGLETQVRALTAQLQQLSDQVRSLGGLPPRRTEIPSGTDTAEADQGPDQGAPPPPAPAPSFGSTTVSPGGGDAIGGLLNDAPSAAGAPPASAAAASSGGGFGGTPSPVATAALPPASDGITDPKQLYETAYGYLLQRDYGAAEAAFDDFLKTFPNDSLSGNAQYWLGESHFVRGQYKAAAGAFLKGYQTYAQGAKAPDSLLKLAMSLDRLGQKDAACSSYAELSIRFPNAPQSVKARAQSERQRVGCP
jgi:tol-pal system protein YbgF